jgi:hypothetical protein
MQQQQSIQGPSEATRLHLQADVQGGKQIFRTGVSRKTGRMREKKAIKP